MTRWLSGRPAAALILIAALAVLARGQAYPDKIAAALKTVDAVTGRGPFQPSWMSLESQKVPEWYLDAKFGIFIHWGVYSVPAFGSEWYPRQMYIQDSAEYKHHLQAYGPQSKFGYKDFIPLFKAEKFDAR